MFHNGLPTLVEGNASGSFNDPNAPPDDRLWNSDQGQTDYAVLPYDVTATTYNTYWYKYWINDHIFHNMVLSSCVAGESPQSCGNGSYVLGGVKTWNNIVNGTVVCATGTGSSDIYPANDSGFNAGTRCNVITSHIYFNYSNPSGGYGIRVNICSRDGDSGGPLWDQANGIAYGILSGGAEKTGPCQTSTDDYSIYTSISRITDALHTNTGLTFNVITTTTG
jgi:streptogrisin C